jgi:hypothetical protein
MTDPELAAAIEELEAREPTPLRIWSQSAPPGRPLEITFAAWGAEAAAELHRRFGDRVELTVGVMAYPSGVLRPEFRQPQEPLRPAREVGLSVTLEGEVRIRTGRAAEFPVWVHNASERDVAIGSNGRLQSAVVDADPVRPAAVGGYFGPHILPYVVFDVAAGQRTRIPVLVGTDSLVPQLGPAIPPGAWHLQVALPAEPGGRLRSEPLPITVLP